MSDFFASLLDRAQQRAPVLQWRRPSMFEGTDLSRPAPKLDDMFDTPSSTRASHFFTPPVSQPSPTSAPTITPATFVMPAVQATATTDASAQVARPATPAPVPQAQQIPHRHDLPASTKVLNSHHTERIERIETIRETREIHHQQDRPTVAPRSSQSAPAVMPARATPHIVAPNPAQAKLSTIRVEHATPSSKASANKQAAPANSQPPLQRAPVAPMQSAATTPAQWRGQRQVAAATPAPLPTIQVAIGRIEIKANPAASPAPRAASRPAGPKLTLDDYLRSQSGGRK